MRLNTKTFLLCILSMISACWLFAAGNVTFTQSGGSGGSVTIQQATGSSDGGSGSSSLAVGTGTVSNFTTLITSPTASLSFLGTQFKSVESGTTNFITLNQSSVTVEGKLVAGSNIILTPGAGTLTIASSGGSGGLPLTPGDTNYIRNSTTLQSGSTAYPSFVYVGSSATVTGELSSNGTFTVDEPSIAAGSGANRSSLSFNPDSSAYLLNLRTYNLSGIDGGVQFQNYNGDAVGKINVPPQLTGSMQLQVATNSVNGLKTRYLIAGVDGKHYFYNQSGTTAMVTFDPIGNSSFTIPAYFASSMTLSGGVNVQNIMPTTNQVLKYNGTNWAPGTDNSGGGGASVAVQDEGSYLTTVGTINFVGAGVSATLTGTSSVTVTIAGSGTPGGSNNQIQYNNSSSFDGVSTLNYYPSTNTLLIGATTIFQSVSSTTFQNARLDIGLGSTQTVSGYLQVNSSVTFASGYVQNDTAGRYIGSNVTGLAVSVNGVTQNHIRYETVRLVSSSGTVFISTAGYGPNGGSIITDITTAGLGGLDTGSETPDTWYYIYLISNGTTLSGIYSVDRSTPVMPAGYSYKMLVGAVKNNSSGNFIKFIQQNDTLIYESPQVIFSTGTNTTFGTYTTYMTTSVIPTNDMSWMAYFGAEINCKYAAAGTKELAVRLRSPLMSSGNIPLLYTIRYQEGASVNNIDSGNAWQILDETVPGPQISVLPSCDATTTAVSFTLYVNGFKFKHFSNGN